MSSLWLRRCLAAAREFGCVAAAGVLLAVPTGRARGAPAMTAGAVLLGLAAPRRRRRAAAPVPFEFPRELELFDRTPVQVLEQDFTEVARAVERLRAQGVTNLMAQLAAHPRLARELRGRVRLVRANRPAVAAAHCADEAELIARFPRLDLAPYPEVFDNQLEALWTGRRLVEQEFRYLDAQGQERACLMRCDAAERGGQADYSRAVLVLLDLTTARRVMEPQMESQEVLRQILARANILLWWARVHREGGHHRWRINVPSQAFDSPLFQLATARDRGGLWDVEHCPDLPETSRRAEEALRHDLPRYQQEFRVLSEDGVTHWLAEDVAVHRLGEDDWSLVGVVTDVTARHEAEEARRKTQAQLQQILGRADCMLWQAQVEETGGRFAWRFEIPASGLQKRIFGGDITVIRTGVAGDPGSKVYHGLGSPDQAERDARSTAALRGGAPGYEQVFRLVKDDQTLWLHERVSITPTGPGRWDVVGVAVDVTDRHRAEEARQATETQLRQILTGADCLLWRATVEREGAGLRWQNFAMPASVLCERLFGDHPPATGSGLWYPADTPDLAEMGRRSTAAVLSGAPGYEQEFAVLRPGRTWWLHEQVSITPAGADQWNLVGVLMDVTARHEAEEAHKASEAQMREILEQADCLLWRARITREGEHLRWRSFDMPPSGLSARLFGTEPVTAAGRLKLWSLLNVPELPEMNERNRQALLSGRKDYEQDFRVIKPEGTTWLHEHVSITPTGPDDWQLTGVLVDVTARRAAEEALKANESQLRQILEHANCLVWQARVVRVGGEFRWNRFRVPDSPLHQLIFGTEHHTSAEELWTLVDVPEMAEMNRRSAHALQTGAPGYEHEFRVVRAPRTLWLLERVSISRVGPDEWEVVGILIDVTARREAEAARARSEEQLQQILSRVDCVLWQARVVDRGHRTDWVFELPRSALQQQLFGAKAPTGEVELYDRLNVPELPEMCARCDAALRAGAPGYEQEFRVLQPERTYWLHERVSITPEGPGCWHLFGVMLDVSALKEAEAARMRSEARLQQILNRADCMLWRARVTEAAGRLHWQFGAPASGLQQRIFGGTEAVEREGVSGDASHDLYLGMQRPERAETEARCNAALHGGAPGYEQEFRLIKADQTFWLHERVAITPAGPGEWELNGITIDVTARREAEGARRESEEQLHQLLDRANCLLWKARVVESAGGTMDWSLYIPRSRLYEALFGRNPEEDPDLRWRELNVPELAEMNTRSTEAIRGGAPGYEQEFRAQRDGRSYWLHEQVTIIPAGPHEWTLVGVITDISARRAAELALSAERERLAVTLRAMTEGVVTTDTAGVVQYLNRAAAELTGWEEAAAKGRALAEVCPVHDGPAPGQPALPLAQVLAGNTLVNLPPQARLTGRDGTDRLVEGCCIPIRDAESVLIGTVLVVRDVTERERLEQELARASKLESVGILAGGIAHDFNNILTVIMGNITLALLDAAELAKVEYYLRETERAALRARDLTQQLLTFAKGGDPIRTAVRLPEIIREVAEFALHGSRAKCEYDFPPDLWPADADKGQIGQVVQNLVLNAVQAMPEGGIVRIRAANEAPSTLSRPPFTVGDYVHIAVADTGTGIKAEHLEKIFDPYFTTKQLGSGLGLATVYSIVKKHLGHIEVESELGRGTTFHIWLPALREQQLELVAGRADPAAPMQGRILLMDDEETIREMARFLLNRLGFEVEVAGDGREAVQQYQLARAGGRPFDLVVMDLTVPGGMGGQEAVAELLQLDPGVKAIVSSGYSSDPVLANHRKYGFRGVVAKPYQLDDLTKVLREVLGNGPARGPGG